jgi:hypothetical protein
MDVQGEVRPTGHFTFKVIRAKPQWLAKLLRILQGE